MVERLHPDESGMVLRDAAASPWHVTEVTVLAGAGLEAGDVAARVAERIAYTPRFRQRVEENLAGDAWLDDTGFDLARHVRQAPLREGANLADLQSYVAELQHQPLGREHPRWEIDVVRSLRGGRSALITRVSPAWVDGRAHVHLQQELLDDVANDDVPVAAPWLPTEEPTASEETLQQLTGAIRDPLGFLGQLGGALGRLTHRSTATLATRRSVRTHVGGTGAPLTSFQAVATHYGCTVHDVVVAVVAGALRRRGERHEPVALVPQAIDSFGDASALGFAVAPATFALPVRAETAVDRLEQVSSLTRAHIESGRVVPAGRMVDQPGFVPATLHAVAARQAVAGRPHEVLVSNVPGPQLPRYLGTRPVHCSYPVIGLTEPQRLSVGVTSLGGHVWFGLCGVEPVDELATGLVEELQELLRGTGQ